MGYPRKSYPHRCPPSCAKRSRPRACARVYIIYRSPVGRSRGVSAPLWGRGRTVVTPCPAPACAGWGRAKAKADAPSRSAPHFPRLPPCPCLPTAESLCVKAEVHQANPAPAVRSPRGNLSTAASPPACVPNHCAQRRKCTRPTPPLPVLSPRGNLSTAAPPPADGRSAVRRVGEGEGKGGRPLAQCRTMPLACRVMPLVCRITVRKGGSAQGQPRPCPCSLPVATCLRPRPCPLMGEAPSARWGRAKAKADAPLHSNPPLSAYRRAPAA